MAKYGIYKLCGGVNGAFVMAPTPRLVGETDSIIVADAVIRGLRAEANRYSRALYSGPAVYFCKLIPPPNPMRDLVKMVELNGAA